MRISKKVREEAARLCSMCACRGQSISVTTAASYLLGVSYEEAVRTPVARVAVRAWDAAHRSLNQGVDRPTDESALCEDYAEAEALLRCGWSPE